MAAPPIESLRELGYDDRGHPFQTEFFLPFLMGMLICSQDGKELCAHPDNTLLPGAEESRHIPKWSKLSIRRWPRLCAEPTESQLEVQGVRLANSREQGNWRHWLFDPASINSQIGSWENTRLVLDLRHSTKGQI